MLSNSWNYFAYKQNQCQAQILPSRKIKYANQFNMETDALLFMRKVLIKAKEDIGKLRKIAKIAKVRESTLTRILDGTTKEPKEHTTRSIVNAIFEVYPELKSENILVSILPNRYDKRGLNQIGGLSMDDVEAVEKLIDILKNKEALDDSDIKAFFAVLDSTHGRLTKVPHIMERLLESARSKDKDN